MLACIFGLTACGSEKEMTDYEQYKVSLATDKAVNSVIPLLNSLMSEDAEGILDEYTMEEIEYQMQQVGNQLGIDFQVDGYGFYTAVESFQSARDTVGAIQGTGETEAVIDGNQIIVDVEVTGEKKNATAEIIFSNDQFLVLESAALNPEKEMGELMGDAALNTLIGMGTVFVVLILISGIISCFKIIPTLQKKAEAKKAAGAKAEESAGTAVALEQAPAQQEAAEDDLELAAVIAAAVAAYEGAGSADGYVVRSIRRRR